MKFSEALLTMPQVNIFQIEIEPEEIFDENFDPSGYEEDFEYWDAEPINSEILSAEVSRNNLLDGYFILKALFIDENGETRPCYVDVTMPERISERAFFIIDGKIHEERKGYTKCDLKINKEIVRGEVVPLVAIDKFGLYDLYYSRIRPEIGIEVLRNGMKISTSKKYIALDLAYILRDEKHHQEAIEAFSASIEEGVDNEYGYLERADLFEKIGDKENAVKDKELAKLFIENKYRKRK